MSIPFNSSKVKIIFYPVVFVRVNNIKWERRWEGKWGWERKFGEGGRQGERGWREGGRGREVWEGGRGRG